MANFSHYFANEIIQHMLRGESYTPPTSIYIALFNGSDGLLQNNPTQEVNSIGTGYSRKIIQLEIPINGITHNDTDLNWVIATENWGEVSHMAIVDHETNTNWGVDVNVLMWGEIVPHKFIEIDDTMKILTKGLTINII